MLSIQFRLIVRKKSAFILMVILGLMLLIDYGAGIGSTVDRQFFSVCAVHFDVEQDAEFLIPEKIYVSKEYLSFSGYYFQIKECYSGEIPSDLLNPPPEMV